MECIYSVFCVYAVHIWPHKTSLFTGWKLPGHCAVRRVPRGRSALHPLPGHRPAGAPAAPAVLLCVRHTLHGWRDEALQPGTTQVRGTEGLVSFYRCFVPQVWWCILMFVPKSIGGVQWFVLIVGPTMVTEISPFRLCQWGRRSSGVMLKKYSAIWVTGRRVCRLVRHQKTAQWFILLQDRILQPWKVITPAIIKPFHRNDEERRNAAFALRNVRNVCLQCSVLGQLICTEDVNLQVWIMHTHSVY